MNWPIGMGKGLEGLYDIHNQRVEFYRPDNHGGERLVALDENGQFPADHPFAEDGLFQQVLEEVELLQEAGDAFDTEKIARGDQTPVFFGSALTNFGVQTFWKPSCPLHQRHTVTKLWLVMKSVLMNQKCLGLCSRSKQI